MRLLVVMSKRVKNRKGYKKPYIQRLKSEVLKSMGFLRKRWAERSTRLQLLQVLSLAVSLGTGIPVEAVAGIAASIAGLGALIPDSK